MGECDLVALAGLNPVWSTCMSVSRFRMYVVRTLNMLVFSDRSIDDQVN